jgi:hypothetical protein
MWKRKPKPILTTEETKVKILSTAAEKIGYKLARFCQAEFDRKLKSFAEKAGLLELLVTIKADLKLEWEVGVNEDKA